MTERDTNYRTGDYIERGVKADAVLEAGKMGGIDVDGFAVEVTDATTVSCVVGRIDETVDNTGGADNALKARIRRDVAFQWDNDGTGDGMLSLPGVVAYAKDDETVSASTGTAALKAGHVLDVDADGVWVQHDFMA